MQISNQQEYGDIFNKYVPHELRSKWLPNRAWPFLSKIFRKHMISGAESLLALRRVFLRVSSMHVVHVVRTFDGSKNQENTKLNISLQ